MAKKKKGGKGKKKKKGGDEPEEAPIDADILTMDMEAVTEERKATLQKLEKASSDRNFVQVERDTIQNFYDITKKEVRDYEAHIKAKDRDMENMEENHRLEMQMYVKKAKYLDSVHKTNIRRVEEDGDSMLDEESTLHGDRESSLKKHKRDLKLELKECELAGERDIERMKRQHRKNLTKLREEFDKNLAAMETRAEQTLQQLRADLSLRRKVEIHEIEERKNLHINDLMKKHEQAFGQVKNYHNDITHDNLSLIKSLQDDVADMRKKAGENQKLMYSISQENKRLSEPLAVAVKEVEQLKYELKDYEKDKLSLKNARARLRVLREQRVTMDQQHAEMQAEYEQTEAERDELYETFESTVTAVKRRSEFKNLVLERKMDQLQSTFEQRQQQFNEVLLAANLDPNVVADITKRLDDTLESRNSLIRDLQYDVSRVTKAHNDAVRVFEEKLAALGIEPDGTEQLLGTLTGTGPAGLVTSAA